MPPSNARGHRTAARRNAYALATASPSTHAPRARRVVAVRRRRRASRCNLQVVSRRTSSSPADLLYCRT
eukprot:scaffold2805_cov202-Prasinococcus_capsulatus_cf.AAC.10